MSKAARKPNNFTANAESINWLITTSYLPPGAPDPIDYNIIQSSFVDGVPEDLGLDLSPFARDRFVQAPAYPDPVLIEAQGPGGTVNLVVVDQDIPVEIFADDFLEGWVEHSALQFGVANPDLVKSITPNSPAYLSAYIDTGNVVTIHYVVNGVTATQPSVPPPGQLEPWLMPILQFLTPLSPGDRLDIEMRDLIGDPIVTASFDIVCSYEDPVTIGFVNRFGLWEFFDCTGRMVRGSTKKSQNYISAISGLKETYLTNGINNLICNTNWVEQGFDQVIQDLMMSNDIVLYTGDPATSAKLILQDNAKEYKTTRTDHMINYALRFESAGKIIPIV
jgi:hypothetical protein